MYGAAHEEALRGQAVRPSCLAVLRTGARDPQPVDLKTGNTGSSARNAAPQAFTISVARMAR